MFELICMSILGACYVKALIDETAEEKKQKEKEKIRDLKISIFCYAVRHRLNYNDVVKMIQENTLSFEDIKKDAEEYERK